MRLRQVAFVARELAPVVDDICAVLGLEVAYRDPGVGQWGLENAVMPVGDDFLEVVVPVEDGTSAGRFLDRRGGDGGYMVILQCADALAQRQRITDMGIRDVWRSDRRRYRATHFHPADTGGVLLSVDSVEPEADFRDPFCSWEPAGPDWQRFVRTEAVSALVGAELQSDDAAAQASLWADILDCPAVLGDDRHYQIALQDAELRFVPTEDGRGAGLGAIDLQVADRDRLLTAAEARGLDRSDDQIILRGVRINLV
jgi:hypothetical protein